MQGSGLFCLKLIFLSNTCILFQFVFIIVTMYSLSLYFSDWSISKRTACHPQRGEYERLQFRDPVSGKVAHSLPEARAISGSVDPPSDQSDHDSDAVVDPSSSPIHQSKDDVEHAGPSQEEDDSSSDDSDEEQAEQLRASTYVFVGLGSQVSNEVLYTIKMEIFALFRTLLG